MPTRAEDNPFPYVTINESANDGSAVPNAPTDFRTLFVGEDGLFHLKDSAGTVTTPTAGMTNPMTTAEDIIYGGASGTPTRKAKGSNGEFLGVASGALSYQAVTDALLSLSDITTNNASTSNHGFLKKLDNVSTHFMDGTGAWSTPASGGTPAASGSVLDSSGDHTVSGTSFADVDTTHCGFSITTAASSKLIVGWSGSVFPDGTRRVYLDIAVDGTRVANTTEGAFVSTTTANFFDGSFTLITGALSGGSHTVRLQARQSASGGSGTIGGGSSGSPVGFLWALEIPGGGPAGLNSAAKVDTSGNHAVTGTSFAAVDTTNCRVSLTTTASATVLVEYTAAISNAGGATGNLTFQVDAGGAVGGTNGLGGDSVSSSHFIHIRWIFTGLSAASHNFDLMAKVDTGTLNIVGSSQSRGILTATQLA